MRWIFGPLRGTCARRHRIRRALRSATQAELYRRVQARSRVRSLAVLSSQPRDRSRGRARFGVLTRKTTASARDDECAADTEKPKPVAVGAERPDKCCVSSNGGGIRERGHGGGRWLHRPQGGAVVVVC